MKQLVRHAGALLTIASLFFVTKSVFRMGFDYSGISNTSVFIIILLISILLKIITVYIQGIAWAGWLSYLTRSKHSISQILGVYTKSNLGKYLPVNVMHYIERNLYAKRYGINQIDVALSSLFEIISEVIVSLLIAFFFSFNRFFFVLKSMISRIGVSIHTIVFSICLIVLLLILVMLLLLHKQIFNFFSTHTLRHFCYRLFISLFEHGLVLWLLGSIFAAFYLCLGGEKDYRVLSLIISGYIISWMLGFIVPGSPGGIGVREYVIQILIGSLIGERLSLSIAVLHRLITIIGDFGAYLIVLILKHSCFQSQKL